MNEKEVYLIGETAYNHEGDIEYLKRMIEELDQISVNAIKFHMLLNLDQYLQRNHPIKDDLQKWLFTKNQWEEIIKFTHTKKKDIIILCDDLESINFIKEKKWQITAIELHAIAINDVILLNAINNTDYDVILGIGGCSIDEINFALQKLKKHRKNHKITLMYGFQSYPTDYSKINLSKMHKLKELFNIELGYCDHTRFDDPHNIFISTLGAANGFPILEKHFTLDEGINRIDFQAAVGSDKMLLIKEKMALALKTFGNGSLEMSNAEKNYGNLGPMKKAIVAARKIKAGEKIKDTDITYKRTVQETYIPQDMFSKLIGLKAIHNIEEDEIITFSKIEYKFKKMTKSELGVQK